MESDDVVEPVDAAFQALLACVAETTHDDERRDLMIDGILTAPPFRNWPAESQEQLKDTCEFVMSLARKLRQRRENRDDG